jgi:hypothetical protein
MTVNTAPVMAIRVVLLARLRTLVDTFWQDEFVTVLRLQVTTRGFVGQGSGEIGPPWLKCATRAEPRR